MTQGFRSVVLTLLDRGANPDIQDKVRGLLSCFEVMGRRKRRSGRERINFGPKISCAI